MGSKFQLPGMWILSSSPWSVAACLLSVLCAGPCYLFLRTVGLSPLFNYVVFFPEVLLCDKMLLRGSCQFRGVGLDPGEVGVPQDYVWLGVIVHS